MEAPYLTVAIVTVGRHEKLERVLRAFSRLDPGSPPFEVVVVIDGDDPPTRSLLARDHPFPLRAFPQPHRGPGPARNLAAAEARGNLLLFVNDDTRPHPGCLVAHQRAHEQHGTCIVLGSTAWDPEAETTPYMAWLAPAGHQNNFARLRPHGNVPWDAVWATNISPPRSWVLDEPFDPAYPYACLDDGEWAYRQYRRGRRAVFVPEAILYHDHHYAGPAEFGARAREFGAAARYVVSRHPQLTWRFTVRPVLAAAVRLASLALPSPRRRERLWDLRFRLDYLAGLLWPPARPRR